jgi:4-amino-4-deoxy-L-arabinose transferase-like glycosyltransferase
MGCGVLTKGPIGVVLPTATIGLFLMIMRAPKVEYGADTSWRGALMNTARWVGNLCSPRLFFRTVWGMRPLTAVAMMILVAGPWYALVGYRTDGEFLAGFFGVHNFGRFLNAMENHRGPIIYYLIAIAIGFFPWSVFFAPGFVNMRKDLTAASPWRAGYVMVGSWLAVWVGFFSIAGTKLPSYVAPAYPALALFMGAFVDRWLREPAVLTKAASRLAWGTVALAGVGMLVALPIVAHIFLNDDWSLALVGLIPLVAAVVGLVYGERGQTRKAAWTMPALGIALAVVMFGYGAARVDRYQISPALAQAIADATPAGELPAIGSFHFFRPSFVFYTEQPVAELHGPEEVTAFFAAHSGSAFLITTDERIERLAGALPPGIAVLDRRPRFLQPGNVLLLGRESIAATARKQHAADASPAPF